MKSVLLKRTYPVSKYERPCDGYQHIMDNTTEEQRINLGLSKIKETILEGETYMYQVRREGKDFKIRSISLENFEIIRKNNLFGDGDE